MVIKLDLMDKNKRYNSIDRYYKAKYGKKVAKISLNGNFSCPNKDGTKGFGGCIYCSASGSGDFAGDKTLDILTQFNEIKTIIDKKWQDCLYMPYLQANSNTYGTVEKLKSVYEPLLSLKDIVGISIATISAYTMNYNIRSQYFNLADSYINIFF